MSVGLRSRAHLAWLALVTPPAVFMLAGTRETLQEETWSSPRTLFVLVVVATLLCAIGGVAVVVVGWRRSLAEVCLIGTALVVSSLLPLVHGLTVPGVLYGPNSATAVSVFVAVPCALLAALPVLLADTRAGRALARHWRAWSLTALGLVVALGLGLLAAPRAIPAPTAGEPLVYPFIVLSILGTLVLSLRQLRLYEIGGRRASLVASVGLAVLGLPSLVWLVEQPYSVGFWAAHLIDALAVLLAAGALVVAHRRDRSLADVLRPIVNRDPLAALELGLTPMVHTFVAALEDKDEVTRDHVVRVGELAMRLGIRRGLAARRLRALGLAALLHDVGKLLTPDEILLKPGELTDAEFDVVKRHTIDGERLLASSALLAPAAPLVRWHHERADGRGYPDGLDAAQIPLEAAIVSVCDAWDAMTFTRRYRVGLSLDRARAIMREESGAQWRGDVVDLLLVELDRNGPVAEPRLDDVGRRPAHSRTTPCDLCDDALPPQLRAPEPSLA